MRYYKTGLILLCAMAVTSSGHAFAQMTSLKPDVSQPGIEAELLSSIGVSEPKYTPFVPVSSVDSLPVRILYDGPKLEGSFVLEVTLSQPDKKNLGSLPQPITTTILYLTQMKAEIDILLNLPEDTDGLQLEASIRDTNRNLIVETTYPLPVLSGETRIIRLSPADLPNINDIKIPDFTSVETISGEVTLPPKSALSSDAILHVQLLENALAGGLSMELVAQSSRPAYIEDGHIKFELQHGLWDRPDTPDMSIKAWITDRAGRKIFIMNSPTGYNGPDIDYSIRLEGLRQGRDTKRGVNLSAELMAQTLIQGEATFDPIIGIPGQARLSIKLMQDRGDFNKNPVLTEQTLLLRGMETRIPFTLTTDSTHFDPYAPAPFLSISLTDINGRVFYDSGEIRAREDKNLIRLHPR